MQKSPTRYDFFQKTRVFDRNSYKILLTKNCAAR